MAEETKPKLGSENPRQNPDSNDKQGTGTSNSNEPKQQPQNSQSSNTENTDPMESNQDPQLTPENCPEEIDGNKCSKLYIKSLHDFDPNNPNLQSDRDWETVTGLSCGS